MRAHLNSPPVRFDMFFYNQLWRRPKIRVHKHRRCVGTATQRARVFFGGDWGASAWRTRVCSIAQGGMRQAERIAPPERAKWVENCSGLAAEVRPPSAHLSGYVVARGCARNAERTKNRRPSEEAKRRKGRGGRTSAQARKGGARATRPCAQAQKKTNLRVHKHRKRQRKRLIPLLPGPLVTSDQSSRA